MHAWLGSALRTPYGAFGGALKDLGAEALAAALVPPLLAGGPRPDRILLGSALPTAEDPLPTLLRLGGLEGLPAVQVQAGPASGLWALRLALEALSGAQANRVLVLAAASASRSPFLLPEARWGTRFGAVELRDPLLDHPEAQLPCPEEGILSLDAVKPPLSRDESAAGGWRDGAAGFLLCRTPAPDRPALRLEISQEPARHEPPAPPSGDFPGGAGLAMLIAALQRPDPPPCLQVPLPEETWTLRITREAP